MSFIEDLQSEIWKIHEHRDIRGVRKWRTALRKVTEEELEKVFSTIEQERLGILLHNACMGFGIGLTVYEKPSFPGVEPRAILCITSDHLECEQGRPFEKGWELFEPFCKKNEDLLQEPLKSKSHYDY